MDVTEQYGPDYPRELGATVGKYRRMAKHGLADLTQGERRAYGAAVGEAIRQKQRQELRGAGETMPAAHCASGTWHRTGKGIHEAVRRQQAAALLACPSAIRRKRSEATWQAMYKAAMEAKRAREAISVDLAA